MPHSLRTLLQCSIPLVLFSFSATALEAATLKVSSFPSGAQVKVDGIGTGKVTPMNVAITEGDHVITVEIPNSGWNPDTRTITIVAGNNDLSVTLLPTPTPGPPGPQGLQGPQGPQGPPGPQGTAGNSSLRSETTFAADPDDAHRTFHVLNGSQEHGALEASCVMRGQLDEVVTAIRVRNVSHDSLLTVMPVVYALTANGDIAWQMVPRHLRFGEVGTAGSGFEIGGTVPFHALDFTVMQFTPGANGPRVFSSAHVSVGFESFVGGTCRVSTITRVD